jgi:hypothetical protein
MIQSDVSLFPFLSKLVGCTCPSTCEFCGMPTTITGQ